MSLNLIVVSAVVGIVVLVFSINPTFPATLALMSALALFGFLAGIEKQKVRAISELENKYNDLKSRVDMLSMGKSFNR